MKKHHLFNLICVFFIQSLCATAYVDVFRVISNEGRADFLAYLYYVCKNDTKIVSESQLMYARAKDLCNEVGELYPDAINAVFKHIKLIPKKYTISLKQDGDTSIKNKLSDVQEQFGMNAIFELWRACKFNKGVLLEKKIVAQDIKQNYAFFLQKAINLGLCNGRGIINKVVMSKIVDVCLIQVTPSVVIFQYE